MTYTIILWYFKPSGELHARYEYPVVDGRPAYKAVEHIQIELQQGYCPGLQRTSLNELTLVLTAIDYPDFIPVFSTEGNI